MDVSTRRILEQYTHDIARLPNETAKTHLFVGLVSKLFPGTTVVTELAAGAEKLVRIDLGGRTKRGRIDTYYGNAVIEFETSLQASLATAEDQLREYSAGLFQEEGVDRPLLCVATDGLEWRTYCPRVAGSRRARPRPDDVTLEHLRTISLSESMDDFWIWLTSLLSRPAG